MLTRYLILVISVLYIKEIRCLQNNSNSVSNIILNNLNGGQSQGLLQKSLNQIASNQGLPINLQQILNSRQATNGQQQQNTQQNVFAKSPSTIFIESTPSPSLQPVFQQSSTKTPTNGYQQLMVQGPVSAAPVLQNCNGINNANNVDQQNLAMGNVQILQQQIPNITPQTIVTQQPVMTPQTYQTITIPSSMQPVNFPSTLNAGNVNTHGEMSLTYPQNQQVATFGIPSYIVEGSQSACVQTSQFSPTTDNNPPVVLYSSPQNLQGFDLSYAELANQPQIVNSVSTNQQPTLDGNSLGYSPYTYAALLPAITQMVSNIPNSGSKPSSYKALLPLILQILKERLNNNCDCCQNCGCNNNNLHHGSNGYEKQKNHGHIPRPPNRYGKYYSAESENRNEIDNKKSRSKYGKHKKVKYEDSYEDYENDDDYD
ncbi:unnamed protein product [Diatraea saccharalis]|uniref:Uncharacterized protein n=1 Tax=Diatraea saccharalis TaxID=40085 RepID=A0A9N9N491_9NEOP|nr:unnamed protein product [Diatraea saccharalis]